MPLVTLNSMSMYYREEGDGFPVVLMNGLGSDHRGWSQQIEALRTRFRCIAFDNRDVGRSDRAQAPYNIADMAGDARELLDKLGVAEAHFVGFSMGAAIAQEFVLAHPERVRSLVLMNAYTSSDPRGAALFSGWKLLRRNLTLEEYYRATFPWVYTHQEYRIPGLIDRTVQALTQDPLAQEADAFCRQVDATLTFFSEDRLDRIAAPTLLIFGEDDLLTPLRFAKVLAERIPHAELHVIPGTGHGLLWTRAAEVNSMLVSFLEKHTP